MKIILYHVTSNYETRWQTYFFLDIVDIDIEKEDDEKEPKLEGRIKDKDATTTQQPKTVDECYLPYYPTVDPDVKNSWRFGIHF